ncbi:MAG: translational GTPase TypA [Deinococcales bacterium]
MQEFRNIAIIAHVDHGKTTLVDGLLKQTHTFRDNQAVADRVMDSNALERERGITILAKNTAIEFQGIKINIMDTPGHADFGGEVERVLGMVDGCLLLVDASEGPMPQTRFVLKKALELGLHPIVVINKIDRKDQRIQEVVNLTFDLMADLGATDEQLDFPIIYAIAREGKAFKNLEAPKEDLQELLELIVQHVPPPSIEIDKPFQMLVTNLDYSDYLGRIAIGRVRRGKVKRGEYVTLMHKDGSRSKAKVSQVFTHMGLARIDVEEVYAGDIVAIAGLEDIGVGETIADFADPEALPVLTVDEPTVSMTFGPNTSPFAGKEGKYVTTRHIRDRLLKEAMTNVALRVEEESTDEYKVSGRGELHLSILIETMRREGYELQVSTPQVITREIDGVIHEPYEHLVIDVPEGKMGGVMETLGSRRGEMINMDNQNGRVRLEYKIPARSLFGFRTQFLSMTQGEGIMNHVFDGYAPMAGEIKTRQNGSLVAMEAGTTFPYAIWKLEDRGKFFIEPGVEVYVGMIVGANSGPKDLNVNVCKSKKLTNMRTSGADDAVTLTPVSPMSLEEALEYISDDELVEVTPKSIRLRKRILEPNMRKI